MAEIPQLYSKNRDICVRDMFEVTYDKYLPGARSVSSSSLHLHTELRLYASSAEKFSYC